MARNASVHGAWYGLQGECYKLWAYTDGDKILYELEKVAGVGTNCVLKSNMTASEAKELVNSMWLKRK